MILMISHNSKWIVDMVARESEIADWLILKSELESLTFSEKYSTGKRIIITKKDRFNIA